MQIEKYISELLFEHNCVIVPDFGGFVCNYSPSRIDPVKHLFEPPYKKILFNKNLPQNDGLLANHISAGEKISYTKALYVISKAVKQYKIEIKQHKRIALDDIGIFYTDEQGNLLFRQDGKTNYLPEAFGLAAFYQLPVSKENVTNDKGKVVKLHPKHQKRIQRYAAAAAAGALIVAASWYTFNHGKSGFNYSGFNLFAKKVDRQYNFVQSAALPKLSYTYDSIRALKFLRPESLSGNVSGGSYLIIAGCFRYKENAQTLVKSMQQHNINASIIGTSPQGLYMVGYGKFLTKEEASLSLNDFRKNFVTDAWVFEKAGKI